MAVSRNIWQWHASVPNDRRADEQRLPAKGIDALNRDAFDRLMLEHLPAAARFATRLTGSPVKAEDLVHDSLVRAVRSWQAFRGDSKFTTWWFQIIVNLWRDQLDRAITPTLQHDVAATNPASDPHLSAEGNEMSDVVAACVSALPPRQREAIVLIAFEGCSTAEAAELLGTSEGNVRTNLSLARSRLRQQLAQRMGSERR